MTGTAFRVHSALLTVLVLLAGAWSIGCAKQEAPPSLVLITVDTLRADYLGAYGSSRGLTPALDALAERSVVFEHAYASAPFTVPSLSSVLTGRFPEEIGIYNNEVTLPNDVPTLASELRSAGWRTAAVVSNFVLRRSSGLARGFHVYDDRFTQREAKRKWPERNAPATTQAALEILRGISAGSDPFFLWVHYQDPHGPYTPPRQLRIAQLERERAASRGRELLPLGKDQRGLGAIPHYQQLGREREVAFYRAGYAGEVAFMDAGVGKLIEGLDALGLRDRVAIVFTADHGEGLGADDYWFAHGEFLSDELTRVPLLISGPNLDPGRREDLVALADLYPTLLRAAGVGTGESTPHVRDLLASGAENGVSNAYMASLGGSTVPRIGLVREGHKIVVTQRDGRAESELFALGAEDRDLSDSEPELLGRMMRDLDSIRGSLRQRPGSQQQDLSDSDREALRALGYLDAE
ncbi:MAG: sulfatase [bacterium]|nr:sulfatase [bacterium]